ncbi:hypothetical protein HETIRDRAFT_107739 [Heterobasidion irregulare TC 32-1]|uniref:Uncharacterized protein n=1 Tax=Heterobasidion irregulare (strain TC 32-1) TaxID=747525 RepID=W4JXE7_HETIT|nr:uncharacterized protein HETIRDRAFT_107739 [Heterobasidion irregulare TC 32-1]ETW78134.1 hypothetical protein HETIRDRAFT_107739 [Heterobasidion irregulare TC 32-1]
MTAQLLNEPPGARPTPQAINPEDPPLRPRLVFIILCPPPECMRARNAPMSMSSSRGSTYSSHPNQKATSLGSALLLPDPGPTPMPMPIPIPIPIELE